MVSLEELDTRIERAIADRDEELFRQVAYDMETIAMYERDQISILAKKLIGWLSIPSFRDASGIWHVLLALRHDVQELSPAKQEELFSAMLQAFGTFGDWMSCFAVSDLAEHFSQHWALDEISRKMNDVDANRRRFLPHMLEHISEVGDEKSVAHRAFGMLLSALRDPSKEVRAETELSIGRLACNENFTFREEAAKIAETFDRRA